MEIEKLDQANELAKQLFRINERINNLDKCRIFNWEFTHESRLPEERLKELQENIRQEAIGILTAERDELQKQFDEL